jgi:AraC-like DNA-binding protein
MEFVLDFPRGPLSRFVEHITYYAGFTPDHSREKLVPDGAIEIIVDLTETPKRLYDDVNGEAGVDFRKAWISGMHRKFIVIEAQPMSSMLVIRFRAGGAETLLCQRACDLTDSVFALTDVLGTASATLRDRVLEATSAGARLAAAKCWLMEQPGWGEPVDPLIAYLTERLSQPRGIRIRDLCAETGYTTRHVLDRFKAAVGVTPKQFARIHRFKQLLAILARPGEYDPSFGAAPLPAPDWSALAAELRYSDQSHLVNEFRGFAGMTPGAYVAAYRGLENYLPIG